MWHLPGPGIEPKSPELAGGFSTTGPPGKSKSTNLDPVLFYFLETYSICITANSFKMQSPRPPPHSNEMPRSLPRTLKFESKALIFFFSSYTLKKPEVIGIKKKARLLNPGTSQVALMVKNLPANTGDIRDMGSIPGLWRFPGGGHGNPRQYSYLENPMDRGTLWAKVHRVTKSWTRLKRFRTRLKRFSTRTLNRY